MEQPSGAASQHSSHESAGALRTAVYPGSFDPITRGHVEIVERALRLFDRVIVAVGKHPTKPGYFPIDERIALITASVAHLPGVRAERFEGLVVNFCRAQGAMAIVRGLRPHGDFEPEFQMALANRDLAPEVETVFLIPRPEQQFVSSSLIREIAHHRGNFERYVPAPVAEAVHRKLEVASRPSGPELASRPSGPELASRPSGPEVKAPT